MVRLPPEITDQIIRSCEDRSTLLSCALVCRGWIPASRTSYLVDFDSIPLLQVSSDGTTLDGLLKASHSTFLTYLRHIRLSKHVQSSQMVSQTNICNTFIASGGQAAAIHMDWQGSPLIETPVLAMVSHSQHSLRRLKWNGIRMSTLAEIMRLTSECIYLEEFSIRAPTDSQLPPGPSSSPAPRSLKSFSLDVSDQLVTLFMKWLAQSACYPARFTIHSQSASELLAFQQGLTPEMYARVMSLEIVLGEDTEIPISLQDLSALRDLKIVLSKSSFGGLEALFSTLPPQHQLQSITIRPVDIDDLSVLDEIFVTYVRQGGAACADLALLSRVSGAAEDDVRSRYFPKCAGQRDLQLVLHRTSALGI